MLQERRNYSRLTLDCRLEIRRQDSGDGILGALLNDLSFGGLGFIAPESLVPETNVDFVLNSNILDKPLEGKGIIRHKNGLEFSEVNKDKILFLIKRIQSRLADKARQTKKTRPLDFMPY